MAPELTWNWGGFAGKEDSTSHHPSNNSNHRTHLGSSDDMSRAGGDAIYRAEGTAKDETEDGKEGDVACKSEELVAGRETKRRDDDDAESDEMLRRVKPRDDGGDDAVE